MKSLAYILSFILCLASCTRHSKEWEKLQDVETYIVTNADSALVTLQNIQPEKLANKEEKAKHALLLSMAMHYYDEDNIVVGSKINCNVVVNHMVELTDEEKAEAKQAAILRYQQEQIEAMKRPKKTKQVTQTISQPTLFD